MNTKMKFNFLILSLFLLCFGSIANAQSSTVVRRACAGVNPTVKFAKVEITKEGAIVAVSCSGKTVTLNGTTYTGSGSTVNFVDKETPTGLVNSSNTVFTVAFTPIAGSEYVYRNGILQEAGAGNDYTISGGTITFLTAPPTGNRIKISYRK
jgi:hypothetical protein